MAVLKVPFQWHLLSNDLIPVKEMEALSAVPHLVFKTLYNICAIAIPSSTERCLTEVMFFMMLFNFGLCSAPAPSCPEQIQQPLTQTIMA